MGNDDIRLYKSYVKRSGNSDARVDLYLFEAYRKGKFDDDLHSVKLYEKEGAGAFHRLKNRVVSDINKSELLNLFDEKETQAFLLYALFKSYYAKNRFELAYRYLIKAERKAVANEELRLLDEIYSSFLRLVREISAIDPLVITQKIRHNAAVLSYRNKLEELSALVSHRLRSSQNYAPGEMEELEQLTELAKEGLSNKWEMGYHTLALQIIKAYCQPLILKGEYAQAASFLQEKLEIIREAEVRNHWALELKIELLIYLINSLNASGSYSAAVEEAELLRSTLESGTDVLYKKFIYFYYQSLVNAYSELREPGKALSILQDMEEHNVAKLNPMYEVFLWVNMSVCLFDMREYAKAAKSVARLFTSAAYRSLDSNLKLKIETAELIIRFEKGDWDFAEFKIPRMQKEHVLEKKSREGKVIQLIHGLINSPDFKYSDTFKSLADELNSLPNEKGQELIDYKLWIQKMNPKK